MSPVRPAVCALALSLLAVACGDDESAGSGGATSATATGSGGSTGQGTAPELTAPAAITAPEGRTLAVEVTATDTDGGDVAITATAPPGIDVELTEAGVALHAGYDAAPGNAVFVATDDEGVTAQAEASIAVAPIGWGERVTWTDDGPEAREHATVLVDDLSGSIYVMFGSGYAPYLEPLGDAWRFDLASRSWSEVALEGDVPPPGGSKRLAGSRGNGQGWLFGGYGEGNEAFGEVYSVEAEGDVVTFRELPQENPPGPRVLHVFALDSGTETFAMFGGVTSTLKGDTWSMRIDGGTAVWALVHPGQIAGAPPARYGAFSGMDEQVGRLVVFSGQTSVDDFGQDTWILDMRAEGGPTWSEVTPAGSPAGRRNGTSVWDHTGPRLLVFGGTSDGATSQPGLFAFDARPGHESWSEIVRDGQPPMRSSGFGAFIEEVTEEDPSAPSGSVWMGFGNDDDVYRDLTRLAY